MNRNPAPSLTEKAEAIARWAHYGQFRRDGVTPYIKHPESVARRLQGDWDSVTAVAWLHDVIEDTAETVESLTVLGLPHHIIESVQALTKKEGQSYHDYLTGVKGNETARKVKIADMLDNLSDSPTKKQIVKYAKGLLFLLDESAP